MHWALCYTSWLTFFAATLDVPTTSPFSSKTSMPVFSSLFLISTTLHTLPVAEGQENEERGASRAIVSAATILTAHTYSESAPPNSVCSHSYVTSQYEWQSIFLLMAKWEAMPWMGFDARIGWMCAALMCPLGDHYYNHKKQEVSLCDTKCKRKEGNRSCRATWTARVTLSQLSQEDW